MTSLMIELASALGSATQNTLLERFTGVRAATLVLCQPLTAEDMMVQSCPESSPVKWHLAHTSWFFETFVLREFAVGYKPFHPDFHWLFNSYYNALGEMPEKKLRASFSRPPLDSILAYRRHVDAAIETLLGRDAAEEACRRIALGLEHEQQHQELIATDIKHALFTNPLHPAYRAQTMDEGQPAPSASSWVDFAAGLAEAGVTPLADNIDSFAFDNETPRHTVYLAPFALATRPVTCAEYLAFIEDDGYKRPELWLAEGWTTMRAAGWEAPLYWRRSKEGRQGRWEIYTMAGFELLDVLLATPVCHVSLFEADAYARWAGHRLPTEFEWEHAAAAEAIAGNFVESGRLHPATAALDNHPNPRLRQIFGDVWEWTQSGYTGYPGYMPLPGALGEYNGKFMSSQVVLRGGSCVTPASHIRPTYRNFFGPATRWQFSGIRLANDAAR